MPTCGDTTSRTPTSSTAAARAAVRAAGRAGLVVHDLSSLDELAEAGRVVSAVWQTTEQKLAPDLLRALVDAGGFVAGAFADGAMVAASVGFVGWSPAGPHLHSHVTGTLPAAPPGTGFALKQHQRAWAIGRGIPEVRWTFDPLVRRNARFNLVKLGAAVVAYRVNWYGELPDAFNAGDETDRCVVRWDLASPAAIEAAEGRRRPLPALDVPSLLDDDPVDAPVLACPTPADVVALRRRDPDEARQWRLALRRALGGAFERGYVATGFTEGGAYVLERKEDR